MPLISIVTPCYNEEDNVDVLYSRVKEQMATLPGYDYEHIFIDNASQDSTVEKLRAIAAKDVRVKLILNTRNFGHIRSPMHAYLQASGDAVIAMAADLQDPPELIPELISRWNEGYKVVAGVKPTSQETMVMAVIRRLYYRVIGSIAEVKLIQNYTGFGLYDKEVMSSIRKLDDPYPYFRGLVAELGYRTTTISYEQPKRIRGITHNNFYTLYDMAMLGITSHSKLPLRIATMAGFFLSAVSLLVSAGYMAAKLLFWDSFSLGTAPIIIGLFFFSSVQLFFIGILGEYIGTIHTQVMKRPLVIERERVNFGCSASDES